MFNILDCPEGLETIIVFIKKGVIPIIQIGIPIILIIYGMIDLGKAVIAGKDDESKKNQQLLVKRAISAVAVFFVVTLVTLIFGIFASSGVDDDVSGTSSWQECWQDA